MNAIIHILKEDNIFNDSDNLIYNKNQYYFQSKHFLITTVKRPHKQLYKEFEQIYFFKNHDFLNILNVLNTIKQLDYSKCLILNSDKKHEKTEEFIEIEKLLSNFSIINNIFNN